jgi:hypothetical protein
VALVHFYLKHHAKGAKKGTGAQAVRYLERTQEYAPDAARVVGYHERTSGRHKDYDDLRHREVAHLPSWAQGDAQHFFEMAYQHEGKNRRWGTSMQANFPRQLTHEQQVDVTRAFVETHLPKRPIVWVIHEPIASDGLPQPHTHLLWSERLRPEGQPEAGPDRMFRRPEVGGYPKYAFGRGDRQALYRMREAWCATVNDTVDRAGYGPEALMDPRSLHTRGVHRVAVREHLDPDAPGGLEYVPAKDERTPEDRAKEQQMAVEWWATYKRTMGVTPGMDQATVLQIIATEVREPGTRARQLAQAHEPPSPSLEPYIGNVRSKIYHAPGDPSYAHVQPRNQVHFASREAAEAAGYRAAVNQHYGPGGLERLQAEDQAVRTHVQALEAHAKHLGNERYLTQMNAARGKAPNESTVDRQERLLRQGAALGLGGDAGEALDLTRRWDKPLIGNRNSQIYHTPEHKNYGDVHPKNQVRFWTEQEAIDAGYRRAANDHYGRGSGEAMIGEASDREGRTRPWASSEYGTRQARGGGRARTNGLAQVAQDLDDAEEVGTKGVQWRPYGKERDGQARDGYGW